MYIDTSKQYWSRPLVSHLRGFAGLVRNTGYSVFCRRFEYRSGYNLESYLGYSIKDFGTTWFRHYSSPDFTLKRLEHAAMLRRLMDSGRSDQIAIKREKIVQKHLRRRLRALWMTPRWSMDCSQTMTTPRTSSYLRSRRRRRPQRHRSGGRRRRVQ